MPKTVPCLWFDGQAEQAAELYTSVFPRSEITSVSGYGPGMPGEEGSVMTVSFSLDGQEYVGLNGGPQFPFTEAVSFQVMCDGQDEVDHYWDRLSEGGETGQCGWLKDRFGLSWQVVPSAVGQLLGDPDPGRSQRAGQALMGMTKIEIAGLLRAAEGAPT